MKKLVLALTAVAAFTGSANAADLPGRYTTKAPAPVAPLYNWTGFYIFGGTGGGLWAADSNVVRTPAGLRSPAIRGWAAAAGSEPSVSGTTGSSTVHGWPAFSVMGNSEISVVP
ncbi:hypothetical protein [Bradyrhizobium sp. URHD0069]|uniref:hypothetical protein n=1 Tax=Bradyrhizobium sp. URHD0069 TaxID=1380355 RepID=UPI000A79EDFF